MSCNSCCFLRLVYCHCIVLYLVRTSTVLRWIKLLNTISEFWSYFHWACTGTVMMLNYWRLYVTTKSFHASAFVGVSSCVHHLDYCNYSTSGIEATQVEQAETNDITIASHVCVCVCVCDCECLSCAVDWSVVLHETARWKQIGRSRQVPAGWRTRWRRPRRYGGAQCWQEDHLVRSLAFAMAASVLFDMRESEGERKLRWGAGSGRLKRRNRERKLNARKQLKCYSYCSFFTKSISSPNKFQKCQSFWLLFWRWNFF